MPQPFHVLIIDDEFQSRLLIKKLLLDFFPDIVAVEAEDVAGALQKINTHRPAFIFLDVQMRGETGFDLLDKIPSVNFGVIFTTAHSEFAVKAFRYSALDYLMKPLEAEEFKTAVQKVIERINSRQFFPGRQIEFLQEQLKTVNKIPDKLTIPTAEGFLLVTIKDIIYCHAMNNYTEFYLSGKQKILSSYTLGYYEDLLGDQQFFRVHRSYLINLSYIKMYKRGDGGIVVMNDGQEIEVSRNNKEAFMKIFKG